MGSEECLSRDEIEGSCGKAGAVPRPDDTVYSIGGGAGARLRTAFSTIGCNPSPPAST